jgi:hypothetical protein
MNCAEITKFISERQADFVESEKYLILERIAVGTKLKNEIFVKIQEMKERLETRNAPYSVAMLGIITEAMESDEFYKAFTHEPELLFYWNGYDRLLYKFPWPEKTTDLTSKDLEYFWRKMLHTVRGGLADKIRDCAYRLADETGFGPANPETKEVCFKRIKDLFQAVMINKYIGAERLEIPCGMNSGHGAAALFFSHGKIRGQFVGHDSLNGMTGGEAEIIRTDGSFASNLSGGNVQVHHHENGNLCWGITGGTVYAENVGLLAEHQVGIESKGGTFLFGERSLNLPPIFMGSGTDNSKEVMIMGSRHSLQCSKDMKRYFAYNKEKDAYEEIDTSGPFLNVREPQVRKFFPEKSNEDGLVVINPGKYLPVDSWRLEKGFVVLKNVTLAKNIGQGMTGGVIIIDDSKTTLEEARGKVSTEKTGGMVFYMKKTWDKQSFGRKKLRDYELVRLS